MNVQPSSRQAESSADPLFMERWSPRSFSTEMIGDADLMRMFEAARWAPSAFNSQPWRFIYARRGDGAWDGFLGCLVERNQIWARHASALVLLASRTTLLPPGQTTEVPSPSHSFDTGAAWAAFALQGTLTGWSTHAMGGFDKEKARAVAKVPEDYCIEAMVAVGKRGDRTALPEPLQALEAPNGRKPIDEIAIPGLFWGK